VCESGTKARKPAWLSHKQVGFCGTPPPDPLPSQEFPSPGSVRLGNISVELATIGICCSRRARASRYRDGDSLVFCHPQLGTPLDPSKVSGYMRKAITAAGISRRIRAWHDLRHTALTHDAASGNPAVYVQARAGHAQASMTERYIHAAQLAFPGAADRAEARLYAAAAKLEEGSD
jgi:hypothetical protein